MLRKINALIPAFLKTLDRQLLLKNPGIWATRIHHVAFWGIIGLALISIRASIQPINLTDIPNPDNAFPILALLSLFAFVFWGWQVGKFDIEKTHGIKGQGYGLRNQLIFAVGVALFAIVPFLYGQILSNKIAKSVNKATLIEDVNTLNIGMRYFPTSTKGYNPYKYSSDYRISVYGGLTFDHEELKNIHRKTLSKAQRLKQIYKFIKVFEKYGGELSTKDASLILKKFVNRDAFIIPYDVRSKVVDNLYAIESAQTHDYEFQRLDFRKLSIFFVFFMWLMLLVFQKNTWKNFLLSILIGGLGIIAGGIFSIFIYEFFNFSGPEPMALLFIGVFVVLFIQAYLGKNTKRLNIWKNISLNIAAAMTPLIPLMVLTLMDRLISDQEGFNMLYIGMLIAFIAWNVAYHPRFVELQSMPKEN